MRKRKGMVIATEMVSVFNHEIHNARGVTFTVSQINCRRRGVSGQCGHFCPYVTTFWDTWPYKTRIVSCVLRTQYSSLPSGIYWKFIVLFSRDFIDSVCRQLILVVCDRYKSTHIDIYYEKYYTICRIDIRNSRN